MHSHLGDASKPRVQLDSGLLHIFGEQHLTFASDWKRLAQHGLAGYDGRFQSKRRWHGKHKVRKPGDEEWMQVCPLSDQRFRLRKVSDGSATSWRCSGKV